MTTELPEVDAFRTLIAAYRGGIHKADADIASVDTQMAALRLQLAGLEAEKADLLTTRAKKMALLTGVKNMVRTVDDHSTSAARAAEDQGDI